MIDRAKPLFNTGRLVATPSALELLNSEGITPSELLDRHLHGDWGDLDDDDKQLNDAAVTDGSRILSSYKVGEEKLWVLTEAEDENGQRYATTLLLASEY